MESRHYLDDRNQKYPIVDFGSKKFLNFLSKGERLYPLGAPFLSSVTMIILLSTPITVNFSVFFNLLYTFHAMKEDFVFLYGKKNFVQV